MRTIVVSVGFFMFGLISAACSSSEESKENNRTTITGHAGAILAEDLTPEQSLSSLKEMWVEAGATPELAACYANLLETEGLAEGINTLEDLAEIQSNFTEEQNEAFGECGSL